MTDATDQNGITFGLIHGGCHSASCWSLLEPELHSRGHATRTVDLPIEDITAGLDDYVEAAAAAFGGCERLVVVGHSLGGPTALGLEDRLPLAGIVLLCSAIPYPPDADPDQPDDLLLIPPEANPVDEAGFARMSDADATKYFYGDCEPDVVAFALGQLRGQAVTGMVAPPLRPTRVPSRYIRGADDASVGMRWSEWAARTLTGHPAVVIPGGHSPFLARPALLADTLVSVAEEFTVTATQGS